MTTFVVSQMFGYVVLSLSFVYLYLRISLTQLFFSSMLFNLHVFVVLLDFFLQLMSSLKSLWSENMVGWYDFNRLIFLKAISVSQYMVDSRHQLQKEIKKNHKYMEIKQHATEE